MMGRILDLGTRWRIVFSFTPRLLYSEGYTPRSALEKSGVHLDAMKDEKIF
jgi:hypothetical protein